MAQAQPALVLDTQRGPDRPSIRIDGKDYALKLLADLSMTDRWKWARRIAAVSKFTGLDAAQLANVNEAEFRHMDSELKGAVEMVLDAPQEVLDRLSAEALESIVRLFNSASAAAGENPKQDSRPNTATSPSSSDSTAEAGMNG